MKKLLIYVAIMLSIAGCAKDGETGPAGPKGDTGAQGQQGTQGQQGGSGSDGNANVSVQNFIANSWTATAGPMQTDTIIDTRITQAIVDSGVVMVYKKILNSYNPLPSTTIITSVLYTMSYNFGLNGIYLSYFASNQTLPPNPGSVTFKVVVISGTLRMAYPYLDWNNYEQVRAVLKLEGVD